MPNGIKEVRGSISTGTHRPADLLVSFAKAYKEITDDCDDHNPFLVTTANLLAILLENDDFVMNFDLQEEVDYTLDVLHTKIEELASKYGCWFGTHPGDGADFGIWSNDLTE